jgi:phospho-N-acetylmuramoyl-pentapeptide-transferase
MLLKLNAIIIYSLIAFFLSLMLYPLYIALLKKLKAGKTIRDASVTWEDASIFKALHQHKAWTPTMWWWLILLVVFLMVLLSVVVNKLWRTNHSLLARQETYILLFAFFSMWILWLIDDYLNIKWKSAVKWLTAKIKFVRMFGFSWFITYWFYVKLWIDFVNIWPFWWEVDIGIFYALITFILTVAIVNAINIADGLDGLVWWLMLIVLWSLAVVTFISQRYLATTIIWIVLWATLAFLRFNINPAYIFMWDSWALAFWWLIAALVYLLNIRFGIFVPFILMFWIFWIEIGSSFFQIFWKKVFKKKLFSVAPSYPKSHVLA